MKNQYAQQEEETLKFWKKERIFEKSVEQRPENDPYVFYDGPPFATGLPHYGHILPSVLKDLFPRFYTMEGRRVRRRWGWDCHGLPVETLVEKKLGISGKKQIEEKGVELFNQTARDMVLNYADQWQEMVDRIGRFVEFKNSYKTMDTTYMESVWWALKQIWNKGLIYEGRKVLMYCPRCETPVSNAEVSMDNNYRDVEEESVYVKFKLKSNQKFKDYETKDSTYMLAWTTTPWTLPANVALAVGADIDYSAVRVKGVTELYILASKLVEKVFKDQEVETVHSDLKGSDLEGMFYEPLFEIPAVADSGNKAWYVATADFVTTGDGTGVVHTAVIYGEDDYALGLNLDLPKIPLLDSAAKYNEEAPEFLQGKYIKDAEREIISDLESRKLIFKKEKFTHSYPFCWRCDSPLIYNAISAWFINIQKVKDRMIELNEKINWYPGNLKEGRFLNILQTAPDWNISRNRYWATALPFWKCDKETCDETLCIGSVAELKEKSTNFDEIYSDKKIEDIDLHRPYIDRIKIKCPKCDNDMSRIPEVIDCWVESASMPFAEWHYPFENKEIFEKRYPGQFIGEYIAQTRAWFYYMHAMGTLLFDGISFENVVVTGTILNESGEKLSKSKMNYPNPWNVIDRYGADSLRFYLMNSVVMQADNLFFNEKDLREIYNKVINLFNNITSFYEIYSDTKYDRELNLSQLSLLDKWLLSRLSNTAKNTTNFLDNYDTVRATREIRSFVEDFSTWWLRRSRERFRVQDQKAMQTISFALKTLAQISAPIIPFTAEHIWQKLKDEKDPISVHLSDWPKVDEKFIDVELEEKMDNLRQIVEMGHSLRSKNSLRVRQPLKSIYFNYDFKDENEQFKNLILDELNIEDVTEIADIKKPDELESKDLKVVIETGLNAELLEKGDLREIIRGLQQLRKQAGLKQGDEATAFYCTENDDTSQFVEKNKSAITKEAALGAFNLKEDMVEPLEVKTSRGKLYLKVSENSTS